MNEYLIDFTQEASESDIQAYLLANNCRIVKVFNNYEKIYLVATAVEPPQSGIVSHILNDSDTAIKPLVIDHVFDATVPTLTFPIDDEKSWWKVYSLNEVDFEQPTVTVPLRGDKSVVYVVDSGIDETHPEFVGVEVTNLYSFTGSFSDTSGHGTAMASLVSGKVCGMTSAAIKVVKIFDAATPTKQSHFLAAFDSILSDFLTQSNTPSIVNLSWVIPKNDYIESKIQLLIDMGLIVVAAAGNSGIPISDTTPADMNDVITIGSYNQDFTPSDFSNYTDPSAISFSSGETNYGELDGWAPGEKIWVAIPGGGYGFVAGTSAAAAIASGASAYNMSYAVDEEGTLVTEYKSDLQHFWFRASTCMPYREGFLDLSDEKYSHSVNKIVSYRRTHPMVAVRGARANFINGQLGCGRVYFQASVDSIEYDFLPTGLHFVNGWLVGTPLVESLPTCGYEIYNIPLTINLRNGTKAKTDLTVSVRSSTLDLTTLPKDDPIIPITLAFVCLSTVWDGGSNCVGGTGCPGTQFCDVGTTKGANCQCTG